MKKLILSLLLFFAVERFCHWQTGSFSLPKMLLDVPLNTTNPTPEFFSKPLTFIGAGNQFYAFETADHQHVVKFMKFSRRRPLPWLQKISLPSFLNSWKQNYLAERAKRLVNLAYSSNLALHYLPEETGLIPCLPKQLQNSLPQQNRPFELDSPEYILSSGVQAGLRPRQTDSKSSILLEQEVLQLPSKKTITLVDKLGIHHQVDLARTHFLIQKKAELFTTYFQQNPSEAKHLISSYIQTVASHCKKGICNLDPAIGKNYGVVDKKTIVIDVGSFLADEKLKTFAGIQREIFMELLPLREWLQNHHPEYVADFDHELKNLPHY